MYVFLSFTIFKNQDISHKSTFLVSFSKDAPSKGICIPICTAPSTPCPLAAWLRWASEFMISGLGAAKGKKPIPSIRQVLLLLSASRAGSSSGRTPHWEGAGDLHQLSSLRPQQLLKRNRLRTTLTRPSVSLLQFLLFCFLVSADCGFFLLCLLLPPLLTSAA